MRKSLISLGVIVALGALGLVRTVESQPPASSPSADEQAIRQAVSAFAESFNKGDFAALSNIWAEDAEYIDEAGNTIKGRDTIVALFKKHATEVKGAKIELKVTNLRLLTGDVALQYGTSVQTSANGTPDEGRYTSVGFKSDGKWLIRSARDLPGDVGPGDGPGAALKDLQWLLGEWEAEKGA